MGSLLLICHFAFRAPSYLLWLGLGYIVPSFSVAAQSFMSNKQLALSAPILGSMYLFGAWASAYAMGLRKNTNARPYWCLALVVMALFSLSYYSYVDDQLWIRMLILNISIALVESLVLFSMFKHYQGIDLLNKIVDFSYLFYCAVYLCSRNHYFSFFKKYRSRHAGKFSLVADDACCEHYLKYVVCNSVARNLGTRYYPSTQ